MATRVSRRAAADYLDEEAIADVIAIDDAIARNEAITFGYHVLAVAMAEVVGRDNANSSRSGTATRDTMP